MWNECDLNQKIYKHYSATRHLISLSYHRLKYSWKWKLLESFLSPYLQHFTLGRYVGVNIRNSLKSFKKNIHRTRTVTWSDMTFIHEINLNLIYKTNIPLSNLFLWWGKFYNFKIYLSMLVPIPLDMTKMKVKIYSLLDR